MASAANTMHNFDTRDMRTLVSFMHRRCLTKNFVNVAAFTETERSEFDQLCAEMDVPSDATVRLRLRASQEEDEEDDFGSEIPAITTARRPDMSRKSRESANV